MSNNNIERKYRVIIYLGPCLRLILLANETLGLIFFQFHIYKNSEILWQQFNA